MVKTASILSPRMGGLKNTLCVENAFNEDVKPTSTHVAGVRVGIWCCLCQTGHMLYIMYILQHASTPEVLEPLCFSSNSMYNHMYI